MKDEKEMRRARGIFIAAVLVIAAVAVANFWSHSFSTAKWLDNPEKRTAIVDSLLDQHELVGMAEADVVALLGAPNNDCGYFNADNRYV